MDHHCLQIVERLRALCIELQIYHAEWSSTTRFENISRHFKLFLRKSRGNEIIGKLDKAKVQILLYQQMLSLKMQSAQRIDIESFLRKFETLQFTDLSRLSFDASKSNTEQKQKENSKFGSHTLKTVRKSASKLWREQSARALKRKPSVGSFEKSSPITEEAVYRDTETPEISQLASELPSQDRLHLDDALQSLGRELNFDVSPGHSESHPSPEAQSIYSRSCNSLDENLAALSFQEATTHDYTEPLVNSHLQRLDEEKNPPNSSCDQESTEIYPPVREDERKIIRPQYMDILHDPGNALNLINYHPLSSHTSSKELEVHSNYISRVNKFKCILQAGTLSLVELRDLAWSGVPEEVRSMTWQLLLGYLPTKSEQRVLTLKRKRKEYLDGIREVFGQHATAAPGTNSASSTGHGRWLNEGLWRRISIDVSRSSPHTPLYGYEAIRSLERILYMSVTHHSASDYVQGMSDLATALWQVFLGLYITDLHAENDMDPVQLPKNVLDAVEADTFWCFTTILDGIPDNHVYDNFYRQPGVIAQARELHHLTRRLDSALAAHLEKEGVSFIQLSFQWMSCFLMREMSLKNTIRLWDTYIAEEQGFTRFHLYVCAAFLLKWTDQLVKMDFQEIMSFMQALPSQDWTEKDVEVLLSEAFIWQSLFQDSHDHP
ncbi:GTPase-activating protein gyp1 [Penicillium frequentans]|uniref:GTPase-activating protein gyp1 n=1 Tax=Penicillium frequentans TaxID=3151616 RepID=A0AAD6D078_9EURO|nr:GTPase-activating protein gyp1 [Penicillium glabrum]